MCSRESSGFIILIIACWFIVAAERSCQTTRNTRSRCPTLTYPTERERCQVEGDGGESQTKRGRTTDSTSTKGCRIGAEKCWHRQTAETSTKQTFNRNTSKLVCPQKMYALGNLYITWAICIYGDFDFVTVPLTSWSRTAGIITRSIIHSNGYDHGRFRSLYP